MINGCKSTKKTRSNQNSKGKTIVIFCSVAFFEYFCTMTLHVFNPDHDIALASGLSNFTAPHAGRQLRHDLGFLPAVWASDGDVVFVDDVDIAEHCWWKMVHRASKHLGLNALNDKKIHFCDNRHLLSLQIDAVEPWGWNSALSAALLRYGVPTSALPHADVLSDVRILSHRNVSAAVLPHLRVPGTVGESRECHDVGSVRTAVAEWGRVVLKAPWSSSGRGLRFVDTDVYTVDSTHVSGWLQNLLNTQGSVMAEPYYNKVKDFGMEFFSDGVGGIDYCGLSLFQTRNGAYTGNVLATESVKQELLCRYLPDNLLASVRNLMCQQLGSVFKDRYRGPFGVDMMIVASDGGFLLHPCVEINLRRTMGHVALSLAPDDDDIRRVMRIDYSENTYKLHIE